MGTDLADAFNRYGSDKDVNGYTPLYSALLSHLREDPITLVEVGIGTMIPDAPSSMQGYALPGYRPGGSLRAWRDWLPEARIIGLDVQPDTQFVEDRIETRLCDSTDAESVASTFERLGLVEADVIIDDGSHLDVDQIRTMRNLLPRLKKNGLYVIEDVYPGSLLTAKPETLREAGCAYPYFFSGLKSNLCVVQKVELNTRRRGY